MCFKLIIPRRHTTQIERTKDLQRMSSALYERLTCVKSRLCVHWVKTMENLYTFEKLNHIYHINNLMLYF